MQITVYYIKKFFFSIICFQHEEIINSLRVRLSIVPTIFLDKNIILRLSITTPLLNHFITAIILSKPK